MRIAAAPPASTTANSAGFDPSSNFDQYGDFDSFINDLLGGRARGGRSPYRTSAQQSEDFAGFRSQAPDSDTEAAIALSFLEAFHGVQKRLQRSVETINVRIPAGAKSGSRIRISEH